MSGAALRGAVVAALLGASLPSAAANAATDGAASHEGPEPSEPRSADARWNVVGSAGVHSMPRAAARRGHGPVLRLDLDRALTERWGLRLGYGWSSLGDGTSDVAIVEQVHQVTFMPTFTWPFHPRAGGFVGLGPGLTAVRGVTEVVGQERVDWHSDVGAAWAIGLDVTWPRVVLRLEAAGLGGSRAHHFQARLGLGIRL